MAYREVARAQQDARNAEIEASAASEATNITVAHMVAERACPWPSPAKLGGMRDPRWDASGRRGTMQLRRRGRGAEAGDHQGSKGHASSRARSSLN
jgi:hypothetical protein